MQTRTPDTAGRHDTDPHAQRIHRYAVSSVWGKSGVAKGDVLLRAFDGSWHRTTVRDALSGAVVGGYHLRYIQTIGCNGPEQCAFNGDHDAQGTPLSSCPNAECADHHGETCHTLTERTSPQKEAT